MLTPMNAGPPATKLRSGLWLRLVASLVLAAGFAVALAPYLSTIPPDLSIEPWVLVAYLASLLPYHLLRAGRWYALVRPLDDVSPRDVTLISMAGYMWIAILPFRLGELARPLFLAQRSEVRVAQALGTVAIERVIDGLAVCALFFIGVFGNPSTEASAPVYRGAWVVMVGFATALLALLVMARFPTFAGRVVGAVFGRISPRLSAKIAATLSSVSEGMAALPSARPVAMFCAATAAYWAANAAGMWLLARGCGLDLDPQQVVALLAIMNLALLIPGGPAQFGVFQTGVAVGLSLYLAPDVVRDAGSVFTFYLYVCQLTTIALLGLLAQRTLGLDWRAVLSLRAERAPGEPSP